MVSTFLASVIGWYVIILGGFILIRYDHVRSSMTDIMTNQGPFLLRGIITVLLGLMMVLSHNIWVAGWQVSITIFAWIVLIKGLMRLFIPNAHKMEQSLVRDSLRMKIMAVLLIIFGLFLLWHVYPIDKIM